MIDQFATWLIYNFLGFPEGSSFGSAAHFFVYDSIKIIFLLFAMVVFMGFLNSFLPTERIRSFLTSRKLFGLDHLIASLFGAVTPFCSCSSISMFMAFVRGGIPLGVTLSFLITSPLVNEVAIAMFLGLFGVKVTAIYMGAGVLLGTVLGVILSKFNLEKHLEPFATFSSEAPSNNRTEKVFKEAFLIIEGILPYLLIGIGVGALIHGFIPTGYFEKYITKDNPLAVPFAVLLGVPMYANATSVIPILSALVEKGIPLGTALAFSMAVVGLSLPEATLLRRVMRPKLIMIFFGSVTFSIILLGYFYNFIF